MNWVAKHRSTANLGRFANALFGFAVVARLAWATGWPHSHENISFFTRTEIFAVHFRRGDFLPIWSSSDEAGMGSPLPFYYHRFFYYISGTLRALGFNVKIAVALTVFLLLIACYEFTQRTLRLLNVKPEVCAVLAFTYVYSTYIMSNLVVRGAVAEFSFTMICPALVYCWVKIVRDGKWPWFTVFVGLACYASHNAMTMATCFVLGIASLPALFAHRATNLKRVLVPAMLSAAVALICMIPYLYLYSRFGEDFNPAATITEGGWIPTSNFPPLVNFIVMPNWFRLPDTVNIGLLAFVPVVAISVAIFMDRQRHRQYLGPFGKSLVVLVVLPFLLQTRASTIIYNIIKPLDLVQFSWKFSGLLSLALVMGAAATLSARPAGPGNWLSSRSAIALTTTAALTIVSAPLFVSRDPNYPQNTIGNIQETPIMFELRYNGEYLPAVRGTDDTFQIRNSNVEAHVTFDYTEQGSCHLVSDTWGFEAPSRMFEATCRVPDEVVLPLHYSNMHTVSVNGETVAASRTELDGRIRINLPAGASAIKVDFPRVP